MYCKKCGKEIPDGVRVCPHCGASLDNTAKEVKAKFEKAAGRVGNNFSSELHHVGDTFKGTGGNGPLRTDRSLLVLILLSVITCGIYNLFFMYGMIRDVNIALYNDGEKTPGLAKYVLLGIITCGIYQLWWIYNIGNRIQTSAKTLYDISIEESGTTLILWKVIGCLICGLGTYVGDYLLIKNVNLISGAYNSKQGY